MLVFNWLCLPGWCVGNGKVSHNFGEHPCTVLVSHADSITILFSRGWYFDEPGTLTFIVYLYDENEMAMEECGRFTKCVFSWFSFRRFTEPQHQSCHCCSNHARGCGPWRSLKKKWKCSAVSYDHQNRLLLLLVGVLVAVCEFPQCFFTLSAFLCIVRVSCCIMFGFFCLWFQMQIQIHNLKFPNTALYISGALPSRTSCVVLLDVI